MFLTRVIYQKPKFYLGVLFVLFTATVVFALFFASTLAADAPTLTFNINPTYIEEGETAVLSWFGQNIKTCQGYGDWSELYHFPDYVARGAQRIRPTVNSTYGLSCFGDGGVVRSEVSINVSRPGTSQYSYPSTAVTPGGSAPPTITPPAPAGTALATGCAASLTTATKGEKIIFVGSYIGGSGTANYSWSGDVSGVGKIVEKKFSDTGVKTVNLTVTDSAGRTAKASCPVTVVEYNSSAKGEKPPGNVLGVVAEKIKSAVSGDGENSETEGQQAICECGEETEKLSASESQIAALGRVQSFVLWFIVALVIVNFGFLIYVSGRLVKLEKKSSPEVPV